MPILFLRPMVESEFAEYVRFSMELFASEKMRGEGLTRNAAWKIAQESMQNKFPHGLSSENQCVFVVCFGEGAAPIGFVWLEERDRDGKKSVYIYDIYIKPEFQGQGLGQKTMEAIEGIARERGAGRVQLHVFGHNERARNLYEKMDYRATNIMMAKDLG